MPNLIDRGKLLETLNANLATVTARGDGGDYEDEIRYAIRAVEGAEGVDIVRCAGCDKSAVAHPDKQRAYRYCFWHSTEVNDNDFCSWGKRKEAEGQKDG